MVNLRYMYNSYIYDIKMALSYFERIIKYLKEITEFFSENIFFHCLHSISFRHRTFTSEGNANRDFLSSLSIMQYHLNNTQASNSF